jgi:hypothetical protein
MEGGAGEEASTGEDRSKACGRTGFKRGSAAGWVVCTGAETPTSADIAASIRCTPVQQCPGAAFP